MNICETDLCQAQTRTKTGKGLGSKYCSKHYRMMLKYGEVKPEREREIGFDNKNHPLYNTWIGMRQRCNDKNHSHYKYYGGKGITVCKRWNSFQNFIADMGDKPENHTLDRVDGDGNYDPSNCVWATHSRQAMNRKVRCTNKTGTSNIHQNKDGRYVSRRFHAGTGERVYVGTFDTLEEAKQAQDLRGRPFVK